MVKRSPEFRELCTIGRLRRCMELGTLKACTTKWASCTESRITFSGSPFPSVAFFWYKECIGATTVLWLKEAPNFGKSALLALYGNAWKRVLCRPVQLSGLFFPRIKDYSVRFSISVVSFWYKECISAITLPWLNEASNFWTTALSALNGVAWKRVICRPVQRSGLFTWS